MQALLDEAAVPLGDGDALPLPWHWFHFLPPIPYPRRMFAGARIQLHRPLRVGVPALGEGGIRDVVVKSGQSGALAFVTVAYRSVQDGALCLEEEQDIVHREAGNPVAAPVPAPSR